MADIALGWSAHNWSGAKQRCVGCPRHVRGGMTRVTDKGNPPRFVMCHQCHRELMADPQTFDRLRAGTPFDPSAPSCSPSQP